MKKTLIAMAVMSVAGATFAQATLYGRVDLGYEYLDAAGVQTNKIQAGNFSGSRWGMRGTEDLGGGLSAVYQLEGGFAADTGMSGQTGLGVTGPTGNAGEARVFGRQVFTGVSGGFGTLTLGRQYTPNDNILGLVDPMGATGAQAGPMYSVFTQNGSNVDNMGRGRQNNSISYSIPKMGALGAQIMYAPDESSATDQAFAGANLTYGDGPISAAASYEQQTSTGAGKSSSGLMAGGMYNMGAARLGGALYSGTKANDDKISAYYLGLSAPVGAATLSAGYARQTLSSTGKNDATSTGFGLNATYAMSKMTSLYAGYLSRDNVSDAGVSAKVNSFVTGMIKSF